MTDKQKLFEILGDDTYGIMPAPMDARLAVNVLADYLLGEDWYIPYSTSPEQANTEIVVAILRKYSKEFRKDWKKHNDISKEVNHEKVWKLHKACLCVAVICSDWERFYC